MIEEARKKSDGALSRSKRPAPAKKNMKDGNGKRFR
jgi:hypothetical protein